MFPFFLCYIYLNLLDGVAKFRIMHFKDSLGLGLILFQIMCLSFSSAFVIHPPKALIFSSTVPKSKIISGFSPSAQRSIYPERPNNDKIFRNAIESSNDSNNHNNRSDNNNSFSEKKGKNKLQIMKRYIKLVRKSIVSSMATFALLFSSGPSFNNAKMNQMSNLPTANAISLKPFSRRSLDEKLASIPCYCITNQAGNLYLVSLPNGFDVGVIYTDYRDAEEALREMNQANEQAPDARITVLGMNTALKYIRMPPRTHGQQTLLYQLCPSLQQLKNTNTFHQLGWKGVLSSTTSWKNGFNRKMLKKTGIPVFYSPSIVIRKGFENIRPIFFSMEDLNYAWERTAVKNNAADDVETSPPDVRTFNLLKVFEWMLNEPQESAKFAFQADTGNQEYVQRILSLKNPYNERPMLTTSL